MKTFFTKIVPFFLFASLFTYDAPMTQSQPNFAAGGQISQDGKVHVPFVGDLTENELEKMNAEVETFLKGLSPKEYEEFMGFAQDLAEELIEKYPEELFPQAPMPSGKAPATSTTQKAPAKESSKIEKSPAAPLKNTNNTLDVKTLLESILQKTASVRQKSVSDPTITTFDNLHNKLVDMVFYLKVIQPYRIHVCIFFFLELLQQYIKEVTHIIIWKILYLYYISKYNIFKTLYL